MFGWGGVGAMDNFDNQRVYVGSGEGVLESQHFIEHTTQCPHIRLMVVGLVKANLRRQVVRCADHGRRMIRRHKKLGDPKVTYR